jgi:hypothetical protein
MLVVPVFALTARCSTGVVVKNGWAYLNVADAALPGLLGLEGAAFLAGRFELLAFLAIDPSPGMRGVLDVRAGSRQCRAIMHL